MAEPDDPQVLRREILAMLDKVDDRGSLLFFQWLLRRIFANYPIPGDEELKALHQAFIRMQAAFRAKKRPTREDMELAARWTDGDAESMGRALGRAVKFFREKRGMSRLQLAKKSRLPLRMILAIERGRVFDISPMMPNLTKGLGAGSYHTTRAGGRNLCNATSPWRRWRSTPISTTRAFLCARSTATWFKNCTRTSRRGKQQASRYDECSEGALLPETDLLSRLDSIRPSSCCSDLTAACYCPAYVGPNYGDKAKILFVGLDSGTSDGITKPMTAKEWQSSIFSDGYRKQEDKKPNAAWNAHYRGCVRTASAILKMACESECRSACKVKPSSECVLSYFAQTNAVKCAPPKSGMAFVAEHRIATCMAKNLFGEVELLQPDVIVLQGRNRNSGHIHRDFERELAAGHWGTLAIDEESLVGAITWSRGLMAGRNTVLALFSHPSAKGKSNFKNTWLREILPSIPKIHALLEGGLDCNANDTNARLVEP